MTRRARIALALLIPVCAALLFLATRSDPREGSAVQVGHGEEPLQEREEVTPAPGEADARLRSATGPPAVVGEEEELASLAVVGRCVVAGGPALDAEAVLTVSRARAGSEEHVARVGADGRFRIEVLRQPDATLHLACSGPGLSRWWRHLGPMPDEPVLDVGDVPLEHGCTLSGTVVSHLGLPVEDARVVFRRVFADPRDAASPPEGWVTVDGASTDAQGRFESRSLPAAVWGVEVTGLGVLGTAHRRVDAAAGGAHHVDVEVRVAAPIEGHVLVDGSPEEGVPVTCFGAESGLEASLYRETDAEGRFRLETRPGWSSGEDLLVRISPQERALVAEPVPAVWGDSDVVLLARALPEARVRVVAASDDTPVAAYALRVSATASFGGRYVRVRDPSGEVELEGVPPEGAWIHVLPHDGRRARSPIALLPGPEPLVVRVAEAHVVDVRVATEDGAPVVGARVEVVALAANTEPGAAPVVVTADAPTLFRESDAWLFGGADTDSDGRALLALPDLRGSDLYLRLTGPAGEQAIQRVAADATHAQLVVPAGATLVLTFSGSWPEGMGVRAEPAPGPGEPVPRDRIAAASATAPVLLSGLAPGAWELRALHQGRLTTLDVIHVAGEETIERELDAAEILVGARPVTLLRAEEGPVEGELVLEEERLTGFVEVFRAPLEDGVVVVPLLPAGRYRATLADGSAGALLDPEAFRADTWRLTGAG